MFDQLPGFVDNEEESIQVLNLLADLEQQEHVKKIYELLVHESKDEDRISIHMEKQNDNFVLESSKLIFHEDRTARLNMKPTQIKFSMKMKHLICFHNFLCTTMKRLTWMKLR